MSDSIFVTDGNGTLTGLVDTSYAGELVIPEYVAGERITAIGAQAFENCTNITSATIPESVTTIGGYAFSGCTNLVSVNIPNGVTGIFGYTFKNCTSLTSIIIPNSVTELVDGAFQQSGLTSIVIPDSVTNIGIACFGNCTSLTSVTFPNGNCSLGMSTFGGCTALTTIIFPEEGNISLSDFSFGGCTSLTSVTIPDSVTNIYYAFEGCTSLTTVYVPDPNNLSESVSSCDWVSATGNEVVFLAIPVVKYLIKEKTLTNLGDKIRVLNGSTETMTPVEMGATLDTFNTEISAELAAQDSKIAELQEILANKAGASGGSGKETVSITVISNTSITWSIKYYDETLTQHILSDSISSFTQVIEAYRGAVYISAQALVTMTGDYLDLSISGGTGSYIFTEDGGTITLDYSEPA